MSLNPLADTIRDAAVEWASQYDGLEQELFDKIKESIESGEEFADTIEDFISEYIDFGSLEELVNENLNCLLDEINIDVFVNWK